MITKDTELEILTKVLTGLDDFEDFDMSSADQCMFGVAEKVLSEEEFRELIAPSTAQPKGIFPDDLFMPPKFTFRGQEYTKADARAAWEGYIDTGIVVWKDLDA